jgi:hypothetical protein
MWPFKKRAALFYHLDEESFRALPTAKLVRILIAKALDAHASAIVFGVPDGADWNPSPEQPRLPKWAMCVPVWIEVSGTFQRFFTPIPLGAYFNIFWLMDFQRVALAPPPSPAAQRRALKELSKKIGSINEATSATEDESLPEKLPERFIEIESPDPKVRRFVEIELEMAPDNTTRLGLQSVHDEPASSLIPKRF